MTEAVVQMVWSKSTPGTEVFKEVQEEGKPLVIGTLYVKKWFVKGAKSLMVAIKVVE